MPTPSVLPWVASTAILLKNSDDFRLTGLQTQQLDHRLPHFVCSASHNVFAVSASDPQCHCFPRPQYPKCPTNKHNVLATSGPSRKSQRNTCHRTSSRRSNTIEQGPPYICHARRGVVGRRVLANCALGKFERGDRYSYPQACDVEPNQRSDIT